VVSSVTRLINSTRIPYSSSYCCLLYRVPCTSGLCKTPMQVTCSQLIASELFPTVVVKALLYPGAIANALFKNTTIPNYNNLLNLYHFTNLTTVPATSDLQRIEVGIYIQTTPSQQFHDGCCHYWLGLLIESFCRLLPPCADLEKARLIYGYFRIMNENIKYCFFICLYCLCRLGCVVGVPTHLLLFNPL
jgi:hypothetical protein